MKFSIDISTENKRNEIIDLFKKLKTKRAVYKYFSVSENTQNCKYLTSICNELNFDFNSLKKKEYNYCLVCGKEIPKGQKFCSRSHSATYNNSLRTGVSEKTKEKISNALYLKNNNPEHIPYKIKRKKLICSICGQKLSENVHTDLCKHTKRWFNNIECFGFDLNTLGTKNVFNEFDKIKTILYEEYFIKKLSVECIAKKYNYKKTIENLVHILKDGFGFELRNISESISIAIEENRYFMPHANSFKCGWKTSWEGKPFFYRSSYELEYSDYLDEQKIKYDYEPLRIKYFDTHRNKFRTAIPDFLLNETNEIIEVKSRASFNKQNMIDKFSMYEKQGYIPILLYEGKRYTFDEMINCIDEYKYILPSMI